MKHISLIAAVMISLSCGVSFAGAEWVYVFKVFDDTAIVVRENSQAYQIEKGVGCLSLRRFEGQSALITSPGLFLGVGSNLLLPDIDQKCRIWDHEQLGSIDSLRSSKRGSRNRRCEGGHWIDSVGSNGEIIVLEDGSIWEVDGIDTITSSLWLPISNVAVCGSTMINTDSGEKVGVTRLK